MKNSGLIFCAEVISIFIIACHPAAKPISSVNKNGSPLTPEIYNAGNKSNDTSKIIVQKTVISGTNAETKTSGTDTAVKINNRTQPYSLPLVPVFPGGNQAMLDFIAEKIQYPDAARKANISGTVLTEFRVKTTGELINIKVQKGIGYGCDEEAIRIVKLMPKFEPGKYLGKPIDMDFSIPVIFILK